MGNFRQNELPTYSIKTPYCSSVLSSVTNSCASQQAIVWELKYTGIGCGNPAPKYT